MAWVLSAPREHRLAAGQVGPTVGMPACTRAWMARKGYVGKEHSQASELVSRKAFRIHNERDEPFKTIRSSYCSNRVQRQRRVSQQHLFQLCQAKQDLVATRRHVGAQVRAPLDLVRMGWQC